MNERELEQEAQAHYQALVDQGMPNALAATLAGQRYAWRIAQTVAAAMPPVPGMQTKPTRGRRETK